MVIPEARCEALLRRWPVARLATIGAEGVPRLVPIVFAWQEGCLWSPVDGKPKAGGELARVRDLRRDPRACVLLDRYGADWTRLWWLRLEGRAEVVSAERPDAEPRLADAAAALRAKYPQYRDTPLFHGRPTALCLRPERVSSWCAGPDALPLE